MDWLRLWHDMPNDPKWRTIARISGEHLALVIACYVHLLVDGSRNVTRGHADVTPEDIASALDVTEAQINAILSAMEGRVIDNGVITGWEKRQPKREDAGNESTGVKSAAQRKKDQRARTKPAVLAPVATPVETLMSRDVTQCHAMSRDVTTEEIREEEIREEKNTHTAPVSRDVTNVTLVTKPETVCVSLISKGITAATAGHPELKALLTAGADEALFAAAAATATKAGKPEFAYVLGIVKNQMTRAGALASTPLAVPAAPASAAITVPGRAGPDPVLAKLDADALVVRLGPSAEVRAAMARLTCRPVATQPTNRVTA